MQNSIRRIRVPLWVILIGQCLLVVSVFAALVAIFSTQMYSITNEQVEERLSARLSTVRESILKPFVTTQNAAEALTVAMKMDQQTYRVSGSSTAMTKDGKYLRIAGSLIASGNGFIEYITQISDDGVTERRGTFSGGVPQPVTINPVDNFSYVSGAIAQRTLSIKISRNSAYATTAAIGVPEAMWLANNNNVSSGRYGGPYSFSRDAVVEHRLADGASIRFWTTFVVANNAEFVEFPYSLLSAYSVILEQDGNMGSDVAARQLHRFPNTWMVAACADLKSIPPILSDLVDGSDSFAALYDVSAAHRIASSSANNNKSNNNLDTGDSIKLLASSRKDLDVLEPLSNGFYSAFSTPDARLDDWFSAAYSDSTRRFPGSFPTSSSLSTIQSLSAHQKSASNSFTHGNRLISYAHIFLAPSVSASSSSSDDSGSLHLFTIVSTPKSRYFGDQTRVRDIMIAVGVVCALVIAAFFIAVVVSIAVPLREIRTNMALAAHLKNDEVVPTASALSEIDKVCYAFNKMNKLLLEARAFMPASMLFRSSDEDDNIDGDDGDGEGAEGDGGRKRRRAVEGFFDDDEEGDAGDGGTTVGDNESDFFNDDDDDDEGDFSFSRSHSRSRHTSSAGEDLLGHGNGSSRSIYGTNTAAAGNNRSFPIGASGGGAHVAVSVTGGGGAVAAKTSKAKALPSSSPKSEHSGNGKKRSSGFFGSSSRAVRSLNRGGHGLSNSSTALLKNRRVAVLCINVRGFTMLSAFSIDALASHSTLLLDTVTLAASAERGVIDSFHGDHFVVSFNAVKAAASPAKKATLCAMAVANALEGTPFACLSMGASSGTAIVGALGNSTQRRLSIVGPCYTKALRLQRASAQLERSVDPLFFVPSNTAAGSSNNNNNNMAASASAKTLVNTPLGNANRSAFFSKSNNSKGSGHHHNNNNNANTNNHGGSSNHHGDDLNSTRHSSYPNCFYLLIDKTSYAESRDVAETLLIGSLATPIRTRTLANVMRKMASLFPSRGAFSSNPNRAGGGGAAVSALPPATSLASMPSMTSSGSPLIALRMRTFGGNGIPTVQSLSMTPQQQVQIRQQIDGSASTHSTPSHGGGFSAGGPSVATHHIRPRPANRHAVPTATGDAFSESILYDNEGVTTSIIPPLGARDNGSPLIPIRVSAYPSSGDEAVSRQSNILPNFPPSPAATPVPERERGLSSKDITAGLANNLANVTFASSETGEDDGDEPQTPIGMIDGSPSNGPNTARGGGSGVQQTATFQLRSRSESGARNSGAGDDQGGPVRVPIAVSVRRADASGGVPLSYEEGKRHSTSSAPAPPMTSFARHQHSTAAEATGAPAIPPTAAKKLISPPAITVYAVLKLRTTNQRRLAAQRASQQHQAGDNATASSLTTGTDHTGTSELDHDEWMYEVQKKNDNDVYRFVNAATESLQKGDLSSALEFALDRLNHAMSRWESEKQEAEKRKERMGGAATSPSGGGNAGLELPATPLPIAPRDVVVLQLVVSTLRAVASHQQQSEAHAADFGSSSVIGGDASTNSLSTHRTTFDGVVENLSMHHNAFHQHQTHHHYARVPVIRPEELLIFFEGISLASTAHLTNLAPNSDGASRQPQSPLLGNTSSSPPSASAGFSPRTAVAIGKAFSSQKQTSSVSAKNTESEGTGLVRQQSTSGWSNVLSKISVIANSGNQPANNGECHPSNGSPATR